MGKGIKQMARAMRENADYNDEFSESGARKLVKIAADFHEAARQMLKKSG